MGGCLGFFIILFLGAALVQSMPFLVIVGTPILISWIVLKQNPIKYIKNKLFERYEKKYYSSEEFLIIKNRVSNYIDNCNKLNEHLSELKDIHIGDNQLDYGESYHYDSSVHRYSRPEFQKRIQKEYVYNCSRTVCDNARIQPFKYVCKYFNISPIEENLEKFEDLLNNYEAARDGISILENEKNNILKRIESEIPKKIRKNGYEKFQYQLGFRIIGFDELVYPMYTFQYVSSGGYASTKCNVVMDINNLNKFVAYLGSVIKFRKSIEGQRALMTSSLRNKIKVRDDYTCKCCGNSTYKEPNLLLEIDHIKPLSKGGLTTEDNLRVLCWRCNRKKGAKLEENKESVDESVVEIPKVVNTRMRYSGNTGNSSIERNKEEPSSVINSFKNETAEILDNDREEKEIKNKENIIKGVEDMYDKSNGVYPAGQYLVGEDIEKGKYIATTREKGNTSAIALHESYKAFVNGEMFSFQSFDGDYHLSLREDGVFVVIENADLKRI